MAAANVWSSGMTSLIDMQVKEGHRLTFSWALNLIWLETAWFTHAFYYTWLIGLFDLLTPIDICSHSQLAQDGWPAASTSHPFLWAGKNCIENRKYQKHDNFHRAGHSICMSGQSRRLPNAQCRLCIKGLCVIRYDLECNRTHLTTFTSANSKHATHKTLHRWKDLEQETRNSEQ